MSKLSDWMEGDDMEGDDEDQSAEDTRLPRDDRGEVRGHGESTETRGPN